MSDLNRSQTVLLVDAMGLYLRHFVAHPAMGKDGQHVGGIIGFLTDLKKIVERFNPNPVYVIWEGGGSPRRRAIYKDYKSHRRPERLNRFYEDDIPNTVTGRDNQVKILVKLLKLTPICQVYVPDCEADDVIGYMSRYHFKDALKIILSADKDYYQLISEGAIIYSPTWKKLIQEQEVVDRFGVHPVNFALAKAVCGDDSDNIPGIEGVGFKTLAKRFPALALDTSVTLQELLPKRVIKSSPDLKCKHIRILQTMKCSSSEICHLSRSTLPIWLLTRLNELTTSVIILSLHVIRLSSYEPCSMRGFKPSTSINYS